MTLNDIVALTKAGFTRDEIMKFHAVEEPEKQKVSEKKENPEPENKPEEKKQEVTDLEKKMNDFLDKLVKMNLLAENKVLPDVDNKSYDFFASVIDPTHNEKKG